MLSVHANAPCLTVEPSVRSDLLKYCWLIIQDKTTTDKLQYLIKSSTLSTGDISTTHSTPSCKCLHQFASV